MPKTSKKKTGSSKSTVSTPLFTPLQTNTTITHLIPANGRIPALVDNTSGTPKRVFEGASMMLYLTAKYDKEHTLSFEYDTPEYWEMVEWMVWMQSGIGPMQGQANHFYRFVCILEKLTTDAAVCCG